MSNRNFEEKKPTEQIIEFRFRTRRLMKNACMNEHMSNDHVIYLAW